MNIKTLRKFAHILKTTSLTRCQLTTGHPNQLNVEGIFASVLEAIPIGVGLMRTPAGKIIRGYLSPWDHLVLGVPQVFPSGIVTSAPGISEVTKSYFGGFDWATWLTLDQMDKSDLTIFIDHLISVVEMVIDKTLEIFLSNEDATPEQIDFYLLVLLGFNLNGQRTIAEVVETTEDLKTVHLYELGLFKITPVQIRDWRFSLKLTDRQLFTPLDDSRLLNPSQVATYYELSKAQVVTLVEKMAEIGHYKPQNQSKFKYYLLELKEKAEKFPESLTLNNTIVALERYTNVAPTREFIDPITFVDEMIAAETGKLSQEIADANQKLTMLEPPNLQKPVDDMNYWFDQ
jgi:hypothetical protein